MGLVRVKAERKGLLPHIGKMTIYITTQIRTLVRARGGNYTQSCVIRGEQVPLIVDDAGGTQEL